MSAPPPKRRFVCGYCPKSFSVKQSWENHERKHTGEKPFKCSYCPKWFAHRSTLNNHERIHSGEKPFQCQRCLARFTTQSALLNHERGVHATSKKFQCDLCPKAFAMKTGLQQHLRVHQRRAEREHQRPKIEPMENSNKSKYLPRRAYCDFCGKSFTRPCRLKLHVRNTHSMERHMRSQENLFFATHQKFSAAFRGLPAFPGGYMRRFRTDVGSPPPAPPAPPLPINITPPVTTHPAVNVPPPPNSPGSFMRFAHVAVSVAGQGHIPLEEKEDKYIPPPPSASHSPGGGGGGGYTFPGAISSIVIRPPPHLTAENTDGFHENGAGIDDDIPPPPPLPETMSPLLAEGEKKVDVVPLPEKKSGTSDVL